MPDEEPTAESGEDKIWVSPYYGRDTRQPYVSLSFKGVSLDLTPEQARHLGMNLIEGAEFAITDMILVEWVAKTIGAPIEASAVLLKEFRERREERRKEYMGDTKGTDE